jgi:hypothetical protein
MERELERIRRKEREERDELDRRRLVEKGQKEGRQQERLQQEKKVLLAERQQQRRRKTQEKQDELKRILAALEARRKEEQIEHKRREAELEMQRKEAIEQEAALRKQRLELEAVAKQHAVEQQQRAVEQERRETEAREREKERERELVLSTEESLRVQKLELEREVAAKQERQEAEWMAAQETARRLAQQEKEVLERERLVQEKAQEQLALEQTRAREAAEREAERLRRERDAELAAHQERIQKEIADEETRMKERIERLRNEEKSLKQQLQEQHHKQPASYKGKHGTWIEEHKRRQRSHRHTPDDESQESTPPRKRKGDKGTDTLTANTTTESPTETETDLSMTYSEAEEALKKGDPYSPRTRNLFNTLSKADHELRRAKTEALEQVSTQATKAAAVAELWYAQQQKAAKSSLSEDPVRSLPSQPTIEASRASDYSNRGELSDSSWRQYLSLGARENRDEMLWRSSHDNRSSASLASHEIHASVMNTTNSRSSSAVAHTTFEYPGEYPALSSNESARLEPNIPDWDSVLEEATENAILARKYDASSTFGSALPKDEIEQVAAVKNVQVSTRTPISVSSSSPPTPPPVGRADLSDTAGEEVKDAQKKDGELDHWVGEDLPSFRSSSTGEDEGSKRSGLGESMSTGADVIGSSSGSSSVERERTMYQAQKAHSDQLLSEASASSARTVLPTDNHAAEPSWPTSFAESMRSWSGAHMAAPNRPSSRSSEHLEELASLSASSRSGISVAIPRQATLAVPTSMPSEALMSSEAASALSSLHVLSEPSRITEPNASSSGASSAPSFEVGEPSPEDTLENISLSSGSFRAATGSSSSGGIDDLMNQFKTSLQAIDKTLW